MKQDTKRLLGSVAWMLGSISAATGAIAWASGLGTSAAPVMSGIGAAAALLGALVYWTRRPAPDQEVHFKTVPSGVSRWGPVPHASPPRVTHPTCRPAGPMPDAPYFGEASLRNAAAAKRVVDDMRSDHPTACPYCGRPPEPPPAKDPAP